MNRQFLLLILIFTVIDTAFSQDWVKQESNTSSNLQDVFFITHDKGFVVGTNGTLLQTTNGGLDWSTIPFNTTNHLRSIYFTDSLVGFLASDSELFKTADGGQTWIAQDSINRGIIRFVDQDTGFVFGPEEILATVDGGLTWISHNPSYSSIHYDGAMAVDSKTFFMWGAYGVVHKSTDGGLSWQLLLGNSTQQIYDIFFVNDSTGYLIGGNNAQGLTSGFIKKTSNKGETWNSCSLSNFYPEHLLSIYFINEQSGFAVGKEGNIGKTTDAGNTWTKLNSTTNNILRRVFFPDSLTGYIVGDNGTILKMINSEINNVNAPTTKEQFKIYPNPFSSQITIENSGTENYTLTIINMLGQIIKQERVNANNHTMDLMEVKTGVYLVQIDDRIRIETMKIVKY